MPCFEALPAFPRPSCLLHATRQWTSRETPHATSTGGAHQSLPHKITRTLSRSHHELPHHSNPNPHTFAYKPTHQKRILVVMSEGQKKKLTDLFRNVGDHILMKDDFNQYINAIIRRRHQNFPIFPIFLEQFNLLGKVAPRIVVLFSVAERRKRV